MKSASPAVSFAPPAAWKVVLAYDGTDFHGWQVQPALATIQGELASAIHRVTGESVLPQGSGRTDAGVHALAQVASFQLQAAIPAANLLRALNHKLPEAIRILSAERVDPEFHARHSALRKTYEYQVVVCDPFAEKICHRCSLQQLASSANSISHPSRLLILIAPLAPHSKAMSTEPTSAPCRSPHGHSAKRHLHFHPGSLCRS